MGFRRVALLATGSLVISCGCGGLTAADPTTTTARGGSSTAVGTDAGRGGGAASVDGSVRSTSTASNATGSTPSTSTASTSTTMPTIVGPPSDQRQLTKVTVITGGLTPKSVVYDGDDNVFAQNMVYSHTVNVYDLAYDKVATISDAVDLTPFGRPGAHDGGPVEAAVSADGSHMYVTNYQMYGPGFTHPGNDNCGKGNYDPSFVYRVSLADFTIDQIIQVGAVPKYIAVSQDGKWVLNSNWCGYDLSVVDASTGRQVRAVPLGRFPRGIAVTPDSRFAYVAVMGSTAIAKVDLVDFSVKWLNGVGSGPRHLVIDRSGRWLYATLNGAGKVAKIDTTTDQVVKSVASPSEPRSMTISPDGTALYVVNYASDAISKIRTSDMVQTQRLPANHHPIGVTYVTRTDEVWVACYSGSIMVFKDA